MKKLIIGTLVILVCGFVFKADSQRQSDSTKFNVGIIITCDNNHIKTSMMNHTKRGLAQLEDVNIVKGERMNPEWDFLLDIHVLEIKHIDGNPTGFLAICFRMFNRIPASNFKKELVSKYTDLPAVHLPTGDIAYHPANNISAYCEDCVKSFETKYLLAKRLLKNNRR